MKKKEIKYWLVHERCFCLLLWQCTQETKKKKKNSISLLSLSLTLSLYNIPSPSTLSFAFSQTNHML